MDTSGMERRDETEREALRRSYRRVFAGPEGTRVLEDLARRGFVRATTFHPEPGRAAFNEGRRSLALEVLGLAQGAAGPVRGGGDNSGFVSNPDSAPDSAPDPTFDPA
ncbi:MAG: hypothetical protein AB7D57_01545 [Desulfovibrionaceae bacterium]